MHYGRCVGGIFARFFCGRFKHGGGFIDDVGEECYEDVMAVDWKIHHPATPPRSVVATLMGLETMPPPPPPPGTADSCGVAAGRRSRSKEDFLMLSFEGVKIDACLLELEGDGEDGTRVKIAEKKTPTRNSPAKRKKKSTDSDTKAESESSSQNSSPVSVLDRTAQHSQVEDYFTIELQQPATPINECDSETRTPDDDDDDDDDPTGRIWPRRKNRSELGIHRSPPPSPDVRTPLIPTNGVGSTLRRGRGRPNGAALLWVDEVCRLAAEEDIQEIPVIIEAQVLDFLIQEFLEALLSPPESPPFLCQFS